MELKRLEVHLCFVILIIFFYNLSTYAIYTTSFTE